MNTFRTKIIDNVADVSVIVGSAVGVGLISGKEAQVFIGSIPNSLIFAAAIFAVLSVFREFCRKYAVNNVSTLATTCFGRFAAAFNAALSACAFVCVVTCLAGVEQCLSDMLYLSNFPLYAIAVAALSAVVMSKGISALKICNVVSLIMTAALFIALAFTSAPTLLPAVPKFYMPVIYALFTFTMSLSLSCRFGAKSSKRQNVARSAVSAVVLAAALTVVVGLSDFSKPLPALSGIQSPLLKAYAVLTIALTSMCGIVGCALPVCEFVDGIICDKTLSSMCVFFLACAFSMFGFDFLVKYGYLFVASIGFAVVLSASIKHNYKIRQ